jgi:hypothetical protein
MLKQPANGSRLRVWEETLYPYRDVQLVNQSIGFNQRLRIVEPLPLQHRRRLMTELDYQREREWSQTEIGKAFTRYTNCLVGETIAGENETTSNKRLRELKEKTNQFRNEFLLLVRGW